MKQYIGIMSAIKNNKNLYYKVAIITKAHSLDEALGYGLRMAKENHYPAVEGFAEHTFTCDEAIVVKGIIKLKE